MQGKLILGADHAGYNFATKISNKLASINFNVKQVGSSSSTKAYDYPDAAKQVAQLVQKGHYDYGILICGSGIGMCIKANRYKGIRAALCWQKSIAALAREHNNANVICLPARFISFEEGLESILTFIHTHFEENERHTRRINKLDEV